MCMFLVLPKKEHFIKCTDTYPLPPPSFQKGKTILTSTMKGKPAQTVIACGCIRDFHRSVAEINTHLPSHYSGSQKPRHRLGFTFQVFEVSLWTVKAPSLEIRVKMSPLQSLIFFLPQSSLQISVFTRVSRYVLPLRNLLPPHSEFLKPVPE